MREGMSTSPKYRTKDVIYSKNRSSLYRTVTYELRHLVKMKRHIFHTFVMHSCCIEHVVKQIHQLQRKQID